MDNAPYQHTLDKQLRGCSSELATALHIGYRRGPVGRAQPAVSCCSVCRRQDTCAVPYRPSEATPGPTLPSIAEALHEEL